MKSIRGIAIAAVLLTAGCASSGTMVSDSQARRFRVGVTTEDDVRRALGPPTTVSSNSDGSAMLVYSTAQTSSAAFHFGPDHRFMGYQITHGAAGDSMGGARTVANATTNTGEAHTANTTAPSAPPAAPQAGTVANATTNTGEAHTANTTAPSAPPAAPQAGTVANATTNMGEAHTADTTAATSPVASHVRLGVHCLEITPELAHTNHLPVKNGVRVATVEAGSVAEAAGIKVGDVILKYGDQSLIEISDLSAAITATTKGAEVPITVWRRTGKSVVNVQF